MRSHLQTRSASEGPGSRAALYCRFTQSGLFTFIALALVLPSSLLRGQPRQAIPAAPRANRQADADGDAAKDPSELRFPGGAPLKTDPEQQRLLRRAEQCVKEGRLDLAAVLWQKVLDEAGDTLTTRDGRTYTSLAEQVERALAKLPPVALETYRTTADAEAKALIAAAGPKGEEEALAQVVRRFFLSSIGDDAAYKLACFALDRHDFLGASRLLNKVLTSHPDPSISQADLLLRLAVAAAHMQDRQTAEQTLTKLNTASGPRPTADILDLIAADVKQAASQGPGGTLPAAKDWHMALGNPARTGHMTALPTAGTSRTLSELWVRDFSLTASPASALMNQPFAAAGGLVIRGRSTALVNQPVPVSREELIAQWQAGAWRPAGRLLFDGGRVYLKTPERLVCYSAAALIDQPIWQSAWENRYEPDGMSQQLAMLAMSMGNLPQSAAAKPKNALETLIFGDRVHQSLAIADGVVYSLEGKRVLSGELKPPDARNLQWGVLPRRTRINWLTAYQASGGKAIWTRSASDDAGDNPGDEGFLAAPTPCGGLLVAPVTDGGTIWLFGLDRATGKTQWKAYLCDEPQGGASPWSEPVVAVEGREAYVSCGCGVVFAVDAAAGTLRWAVRYNRDGKPNAMLRNMYGGNFNPMLDLNGWDDDVVIPFGRALIVMSSDSDKLVALDRRTGDLLWESPRTSPLGSVASYCLGVSGRGLFVAGKNVVRRYDLVSGRLVWEKEINDSFGRGCLTDDAVYVPVKDSILKLDPEKGRELSQVGVALTSDEPVGNLFSDGDKLWVVGAGRVYAMTALEHRLAMLAEQIAAGNAEAQLHRMRLQFKRNRADEALADLRGAYALLQAQHSPDEAATRLLGAISEQKLSQSQPLVVLGLLTELFATAPSQPALGREAASRLSDAVASSLSGLRQQKPAGSTAAVLAAAPLLKEEYLITAATFAIDALANTEDAVRLIEAVHDGSPAAKLVAIRALTRLVPDAARQPLAAQLADGDDRVRLAAARGLANLGERKDVLETLVRLLESTNVVVRSRSQQSLQALTSQQFPFAPEGSPADRAATIKAWQQWIDANGATAKLNLPLAERAAVLGRILLVAQGALLELDADHKERWKTRLAGAAWGCQGLSNGHRLVAINSHAMVIEYDDSGKEVWRKDRLPAPPTSVQRLDSGNTLVACGNAQQVVEIAPDGSTTSINVQGYPISAQRLDNGNTLVALQQAQRVVEVDVSGRIVWEAQTQGNPPWHAVRLDNGNTLVTLTQARQVVEYDPTGKTVVWRTQVPLVNPFAAHRLPSGNTLVADHNGIQEIDPSGKQVRFQHRQPQVTGLSSF